MKSPFTVGVIRYLRPKRFNEEVKLTHDNLGGITFAITIDHMNSRLWVAWSICKHDDNFSKELGRTQAFHRLHQGKFIVLAYDKDSDLLSNIVNQVNSKAVISSTVSADNLRTLSKQIQICDERHISSTVCSSIVDSHRSI